MMIQIDTRTMMGIRFTARIDKQRADEKVKTEIDFRTVVV
jgi:hypothetical protein